MDCAISCCTFLMLYHFHVALCSYWTILILYFFRVALFLFIVPFHVALIYVAMFSICILLLLHYYHVAIFSCCVLFMLHFPEVYPETPQTSKPLNVFTLDVRNGPGYASSISMLHFFQKHSSRGIL